MASCYKLRHFPGTILLVDARYIAWLPFTSFMFYGFEAILINELEGLTIYFDPSGYQGLFLNGGVVLEQLGFKESTVRTH